ncbi:histidine phosphatase family protein [Brumicola pallidula]|jgi:broad specificity phosphatase PhoE|uniref:PABS domain-containing protein n=1 Tax=Brumicola pallidula DSM 14239 = ACAM 615 TaxID=1121922 RepID=K6ZJI8_9ALTE|nr:hypothetical protein GPAL_2187 [Glaciecola pallidula DSM 14239 = ACAM 615]
MFKKAFTVWSKERLPKHEESYLKFRQRVTSVVDDLRSAKGNNILVINSGGILRHMVADALRLDNRWLSNLVCK